MIFRCNKLYNFDIRMISFAKSIFQKGPGFGPTDSKNFRKILENRPERFYIFFIRKKLHALQTVHADQCAITESIIEEFLSQDQTTLIE